MVIELCQLSQYVMKHERCSPRFHVDSINKGLHHFIALFYPNLKLLEAVVENTNRIQQRLHSFAVHFQQDCVGLKSLASRKTVYWNVELSVPCHNAWCDVVEWWSLVKYHAQGVFSKIAAPWRLWSAFRIQPYPTLRLLTFRSTMLSIPLKVESNNESV